MSSMWIKKLKGLKKRKKRRTLEDILSPEEMNRMKEGAGKLTSEDIGVEIQNSLIAHLFAINSIMQGVADLKKTNKISNKIIDMFEDVDYATIFVTLDYLNFYFNSLLRERIKERGQEDIFKGAICEYAKITKLDKLLGLKPVSEEGKEEFSQMFR